MRWMTVCQLDDILPYSGVAALVHGEQVAIFRVGSSVFAISNYDPFSNAYVLSRGIVGDRKGVLKVASPIYKHNFDLLTGKCLDDESVTLPVWETRIIDAAVQVKVSH